MKKYLLSIALCLVSLLCQAGFNEGVTAYDKGDYQTALQAWKAVAEQKPSITGDFEWRSSQSKNSVEAQYGLALLYWQGKGVAQNYQEAKKWLILAATSGHSEAQLKLAYLYLVGLTGQSNVADACKWFEQSAQQGNVNAQYNLGLLYWKGLGVTQDPVAAKKWLTAAASQGDPSAKELLAEINATSTQTATSIPKAVETQSVPTPVTTTQAVGTQGAPAPAPAPVTTNPQPFSAASPVTTQVVGTQGAPAPMNDYYAIQLFASAKQNDVLQFMEAWRDLSPLIMTDKIKKAERIFVLVYGSYATTAEAKQVINNLPTALKKHRPWIVKMRGDALAP